MSLRDIIDGARNEAAENQKSAQKNAQAVQDSQNGVSQGFEKRSIARAKPTREKSVGVRVETVSHGKAQTPSKPKTEMTKEEKREARQKERDAEDRRLIASQAMLQADERYKKNHRLSIIMISVGLGFTLLSWLITIMIPEAQYDMASTWGTIAIITLIIAYIGVVGGFIVDWARLHKLRSFYNDKVRAMTDKQLDAVIDKRNRELAAKPSFFDRFRHKKPADTPEA